MGQGGSQCCVSDQSGSDKPSCFAHIGGSDGDADAVIPEQPVIPSSVLAKEDGPERKARCILGSKVDDGKKFDGKSRGGHGRRTHKFETLLLRRPGERLGLDIDCLDGRTAVISSIDQGVVASYNAAVDTSRKLTAGDRLLQVNDASQRIWDVIRCLEEAEQLKLVVQRGSTFNVSVDITAKQESLGLMFQVTGDGRGYGLMIDTIVPGAITEWNAQHPEFAVHRFDRVVEVCGQRGTPGELQAFIASYVSSRAPAGPLQLTILPCSA